MKSFHEYSTILPAELSTETGMLPTRLTPTQKETEIEFSYECKHVHNGNADMGVASFWHCR